MSITGTFIDYASSFVMQRQHAELYERLYAFASEDFVNNLDNEKRHKLIDIHLIALQEMIEVFRTTFNLHIHNIITPKPGEPVTPTIVQFLAPYPIIPAPYINTTGAITNLINKIIPYGYLSYVDLRETINRNKILKVDRRSINLPINSGSISPSLVRL